jgi:hypothetical protein
VFGSDEIMHVAAEPQVQREFSSDQVFRVEQKTGQVQQLIGPPNFLFAPIGAVGATKPPVTPPAPRQDAATTVALTGQRGDTAGDTRVTATITNNTNFTFSNVKQQSVTVAPPTDPVLQAGSAISVQGPAAVLEIAGGNAFYRLTGPFNLPVSCTDPPCSTLVSGDITVSIDRTLGLAYVRVNTRDNEGGVVNIGTPPAARGIPITVSGNQISFSGTFNRDDPAFVNNQGAFRCFDCGFSPFPDFFESMTFSGTVSGSTATLTVSARSPDGESGSVTGTLAQQSPPNGLAAAMVIQRKPPGNPTGSVEGANSISAAMWDVDLDASGRALRVAQGGFVGGARTAVVGSAGNTTAGSAPAAGNLVWGAWTGPGATITDFNYNTFTTSSGQNQPWITGTATTTLPVSLGTSVVYTPIGSLVNPTSSTPNGVLNSGTLTANFVTRTVDVSLNATNIQAGNTFQMNGSSGIVSTTGRFQSGFTSVTASCPSTCPGAASGGFAGFFAGPNAEGAGVAFNAGFGAPGGGVSGVAAMKR